MIALLSLAGVGGASDRASADRMIICLPQLRPHDNTPALLAQPPLVELQVANCVVR
jgi:hypothetical protein